MDNRIRHKRCGAVGFRSAVELAPDYRAVTCFGTPIVRGARIGDIGDVRGDSNWRPRSSRRLTCPSEFSFPAAMISLVRLRELMADQQLSEAELEELRTFLGLLAELVCDLRRRDAASSIDEGRPPLSDHQNYDDHRH